jgi:hypothetical protein
MFTSALGVGAPIAVATIAGIEKYDADLTILGGVGIDYRIVFHLSSGLKRYWSFTSSANRDSDYTNILTKYAFDCD